MRAPEEIVFIARESEDGGYFAKAEGYGIFTQGETWEELIEMIKDAVKCHFDERVSEHIRIVFTMEMES